MTDTILRTVRCPDCKLEKHIPEWIGAWCCRRCGGTYKVADTAIDNILDMLGPKEKKDAIKEAGNELVKGKILSGVKIL